MILLAVLLLPLLGAFLAWPLSRPVAKLVMILFLLADLVLLLSQTGDSYTWLAQWSAPWIPQLGISFSFALDGLALFMAELACILGIVAVVVMNVNTPQYTLRSFLMMSTITANLGVFLAADLILFFVFYEVMLVPMFAWMILGGHPNRVRAATRFFLFTQAGGLLMLIAILALYVEHGRLTGVYTFAYTELLGTPLSSGVATLILLGFFAAFAVKLPLVPFHTWQADAYEAAPTEAGIILAGLMAKAAGYGLLRFAVPLAPAAAADFAPTAMALAVITILYAAWVAYGQTDLKRLIAYSSASHLGFIVLGAFSQNDLAQRGAILQMFCHGISVAGLFFLAAFLERTAKTRDIDRLGGLWHSAPQMSGFGLVFALATLGLPGLGNFTGEILVLLGTYQSHPKFAAIAALGAVLSAAYSLRMVQRIFFGPAKTQYQIPDPPAHHFAIPAALTAILVILGLFPQTFLAAARVAGVNYPRIPAELRAADIPNPSEPAGDHQ